MQTRANTFGNNQLDREGKERLPKRKNPKIEDYGMKTDYREFSLAGMSCALLSIPPLKKIQITAGCECISWNDDTYHDDVHYSIRIIRVTVCTIVK